MGRGNLDNSGFHYSNCAGGPCGCDGEHGGHGDGGGFLAVIVMVLSFASLALIGEWIGIPLEDWSVLVMILAWVGLGFLYIIIITIIQIMK